jgi:hypothetical protein
MKKLILVIAILGVTSSAYAQAARRNTANYGPGARGTAEWGKTAGSPEARRAAGRASNCTRNNRTCDAAKK